MRGSPGTWRSLALLLAAALAGCGDPAVVPGPKPALAPDAPQAPQAETPTALPRRATYDVIPAGDDWGAIEGTVRLTQALTPSRVRPVRAMNAVSWTEAESDRLKYDAGRLTLGQAFVFLREISRGKDWPDSMRADERTLTITLRDGFLVPHVAWVRRGTGLELVNESTSQENLRAYALPLVGMPRTHLVFNVMLSAGARLGPSSDLRLRHAGPNVVLPDCCFDWISANVFASHHPYVAGPTETDGTYVLEHVPPGTYDVVAWHGPMHLNQTEAGPRHGSGPYSVLKRVTVAARARAQVDFTPGPP